MLRSSEFWVAIAAAIGAALTAFKVIPQDQWEKVLYPALVYVIGRLTSKGVKAIF